MGCGNRGQISKSQKTIVLGGGAMERNGSKHWRKSFKEFRMLGLHKDVPLPSSLRSSGFVMPKLLTFRRNANGVVEIHSTVQVTPFDQPLFILTTTAASNAYETLSLSDSVQQRARLKSLLPIRVSNPKYPSFAVECVLNAQSSFTSDAEFASVDMYGHRFSVLVAQPPGTKLEEPCAKFSYHTVDYIYTRAQLHGTLLSPLSYAGDAAMNQPGPAKSARTGVAVTTVNTDSAFQMNLMSRKKKTNWTKEKYSVFASAEASRSAFYSHYVQELKAQRQQQQQQQPQTSYSDESRQISGFEFPTTSTQSLGRRGLSTSSSANNLGTQDFDPWDQEWSHTITPTTRPYSSTGYYPRERVSSSPIMPQRSSGYFQRSSFPRGGGPGNIPMPAALPTHQQQQQQFHPSSYYPADNKFSAIYSSPQIHSQPETTTSSQPVQQQQQQQATHLPVANLDKYPVFGVIHLTDSSTSVSEADGLRDLAILVASVYATWSRSVLKPLEKLEYHYLNR
ncbi:hypothetical protein BDR26DRAFT_868754 [Obelidium mucronatum]|nr:hypothetical protein BDR26DRAFT_868754 [Obelidium mucronatum]